MDHVNIWYQNIQYAVGIQKDKQLADLLHLSKVKTFGKENGTGNPISKRVQVRFVFRGRREII
jgi:hypothetical protein